MKCMRHELESCAEGSKESVVAVLHSLGRVSGFLTRFSLFAINYIGH